MRHTTRANAVSQGGIAEKSNSYSIVTNPLGEN